MKKRNFILGSLAGILFMAFTAANVTVSQSYQGNKASMEFTLTQLVAKAASASEYKCADPVPPSICSSENGSNCFVPGDHCH